MSDYVTCVLCDHSIVHGRDARRGYSRYGARFVREWRTYLCRDCDGRNWDGIVTNHHPGFEAKMAALGITLERNEAGLVKIPLRGA